MRALKFAALFLVLSLAPFTVAQQQPAPPPGTEPPGATTPTQPPDKKKPEHKISDKEAKQLFADVDEILKFVSKDTGLPIKHPVKRALASREEVRKYLQETERDDEDTKRLERTGIILKKLGLLPREFDLGKFLDDVLEEQVAGYYDTKTKTIYLLDWVEPEEQKPVLAHELTHALQDQNYDLEKFLKKGVKEEDQSKELKSHDEITVKVDEPGTARHSIVEGQAQIVLFDYILAPSGRSVADSPMIIEMAQAAAKNSTDQYPVMAKAPLYIKDSLMFPYTTGMDFEEAMLHKGGKDLAFNGVLAKPPRNTREVMQPDVYRSDEHLEPLTLPDMHKLLASNYEAYDVGNLGEFDVQVLLKQFAGEKAANKLSPHFRGGAYYATERTGGKAGTAAECGAKPTDPKALEQQRVSCLALLMETRWDTPEAANQWAHRYSGLLLAKYKVAQSLTDEAARAKQNPDKVGQRCFDCQGGERWNTDEGMVVIQQKGNQVIVLETFDDTITPKLLDAALPLVASPQSTVHSPQ
jgi:hypothetical protein